MEDQVPETILSVRRARKKRPRHYWNSLAVLESLRLESINHVDVSVIDYLASMTNGGRLTRTCFPSFTTIAQAVGIDRSTAIRSIKRLRRAGLITIEKAKMRRSNLYTLVDGGTGATVRGRDNTTVNSGTDASRAGALVPPDQEPIDQEPPPSRPSDEWTAAEVALARIGVGRISDTIRAARINGLSAADVTAIVGFAESKPGAYGPGAVYSRIMNGRAGQSPEAGWPPESEEYRRQERAAKDGKRRSQETLEREQRGRLLEAERAEAERLESDFGPILDSMDRASQMALAQQHLDNQFLLQRFCRDPNRATMARQILLRVISQERFPNFAGKTN